MSVINQSFPGQGNMYYYPPNYYLPPVYPNPYTPPPSPRRVCPGCGRCEHCGYPRPWPRPQPYWYGKSWTHNGSSPVATLGLSQ